MPALYISSRIISCSGVGHHLDEEFAAGDILLISFPNFFDKLMFERLKWWSSWLVVGLVGLVGLNRKF